MKERFLPIGTVVLLKDSKKEIMITSYCIFPTGEVYENNEKVDNTGKMYEYGACLYPEGIVKSELIYGFNHDQIEKICHMGYETDEQKELSRILNGSLEIYKNKQANNNESQN